MNVITGSIGWQKFAFEPVINCCTFFVDQKEVLAVDFFDYLFYFIGSWSVFQTKRNREISPTGSEWGAAGSKGGELWACDIIYQSCDYHLPLCDVMWPSCDYHVTWYTYVILQDLEQSLLHALHAQMSQIQQDVYRVRPSSQIVTWE